MMPGNYTDTSLIDDGEAIDAAPVATAIDALDDALKAEETARAAAVTALKAEPFITASSSSDLTNETTLAAALASPPTIGSTTPGQATFSRIEVNESAATPRTIRLNTGGTLRWLIQSDGAESGANTGSEFRISRFSDAGSFLAHALTITRSSGAVTVTGALSKGSGSFKITHPLDPDYWLYHSFIEGPKCDLIYRGEVALVDGYAEVDLNAEARMRPATFEALTQNPQVFLQNQSQTSWDRVRGHVEDGTLYIECENPASTDTVGWMVVTERADDFIKTWELTDDDGRLIPEHPKTDAEKNPPQTSTEDES